MQKQSFTFLWTVMPSVSVQVIAQLNDQLTMWQTITRSTTAVTDLTACSGLFSQMNIINQLKLKTTQINNEPINS